MSTTPFAALEELPRALAARDFSRLERCLHPDVRLRALTPGLVREATSASAASALFAEWFGDATELRIVAAEVEALPENRSRLRFRLSGVELGQAFVAEQTAYCELADGAVAAMDLVCSGFRRDPAAASGRTVHDFDAGELGCGSGLPAEVRRRLAAIAVGDRLRVVTHDPSAREDLPALARLLGHRVLGVEQTGDGTTITMERTR